MNIPEKLPEPWYWDATDLTTQLTIELSPTHILKNVSGKSIARRQDMDDVLFELKDVENRYAVVHLTWSRHPQEAPFPMTQLYKDWNDLYKNKLLVDAQAYLQVLKH